MSEQFQLRRGLKIENDGLTGQPGEMSVVIDPSELTVLRIHDGITLGGVELARADLLNVASGSFNGLNTLASSLLQGANGVNLIKFDNAGIAIFEDELSGDRIQVTSLPFTALTSSFTDAILKFDGSGNLTPQLKIENANIDLIAVTSAKIGSNVISNSKFASSSVITSTIIDESIPADRIVADAAITLKFISRSVTEDKIEDQSVTAAKILAPIETTNITNATIENTRIADGIITGDKINAWQTGNARGTRFIQAAIPLNAQGNDGDIAYVTTLTLPPPPPPVDPPVVVPDMQSAWFDGSLDNLSRNFSGAGNRKTWTFSTWVQRNKFGGSQSIFGTDVSGINNEGVLEFTPADILILNTDGVGRRATKAVFRDSSWYHIVVSIDTTQSTANNRIQIFVNGNLLTDNDFDVITNPGLNADLAAFNNLTDHRIGARIINTVGALSFFNGYISQATFIDGQSIQAGNLTIDNFGAFVQSGSAPESAIWAPRPNSAVAALANSAAGNSFMLGNNIGDGLDTSTNNNNFTPTSMTHALNGSLNAPINHHQHFNPLDNFSWNFFKGNKECTGVANVVFGYQAIGTIYARSGKFHIEFEILGSGSAANGYGVGIATNATFTPGFAGGEHTIALLNQIMYDSGVGIIDASDGTVLINPSTAYTNGDRIAMEVDFDGNQVEFFKNGVSVVTVIPKRPISEQDYTIIVGDRTFIAVDIRYRILGEASEFLDTVTPGFTPWSTRNVGTPTVQGGDFFKATPYIGDASSIHEINGVGFQPDLVWIKGRNFVSDHALTDSIRGAGLDLKSNTTDGQGSNIEILKSFNPDGFTVGNNVTANSNGETLVAWNWKKGSAPGFDIVPYTGNGAATANIAHTLGKVPAFIIVKQLTTSTQWRIFHKDLPTNTGLSFTQAVASGGTRIGSNHTTTTFELINEGGDGVNASGLNYIAYVWAEIPGFSSFGSYTSNGIVDGPFINCGFRPAYVMIKSVNAAGLNWTIADVERDGFNDSNFSLLANDPRVEDTAPQGVNSGNFGDFLSNGFKLRSTLNSVNDNAGQKYVYFAFGDVAGGGSLPALPGSIGGGSYPLPFASVLFNVTGKMERTVPATVDDKKWTLSWWQKLDDNITSTKFFYGNFLTTTDSNFLSWSGINQLNYSNQFSNEFFGNAAWAPPIVLNEWQHFVLHFDSNNVTSTLRQRLFVDGNALGDAFLGPETGTGSGSINGIQGQQTRFNQTGQTSAFGNEALDAAFPGKVADIYMIDGTLELPSAFRGNDGKPVQFTGSFGTSGFHLNFLDENNLGNDVSDNNNDHVVTGPVESSTDGPSA